MGRLTTRRRTRSCVSMSLTERESVLLERSLEQLSF